MGAAFAMMIGAGEEIRTPDPRITNALLYQLSYPGEGAKVYGKKPWAGSGRR
jgi:hypothetical protein